MICPWWLAYTFDHPGRRLFHKPEAIFAPYLAPGMTVMDVGCGMGFFSIGMARLVGDGGAVIAVDLQQKMLDVLMQRAARAGVAGRICPRLCTEDDLRVHERVDFALTFYMVHEVRDTRRLLFQIKDCLKPGGKLLIAEPKIHVTRKNFDSTIHLANDIGLRLVETPVIALSHTALLASLAGQSVE